MNIELIFLQRWTASDYHSGLAANGVIFFKVL